MRRACDRAGALCRQRSIAAAMVISKTCLAGKLTSFEVNRPLQRRSTKGNDRAAPGVLPGWRRTRKLPLENRGLTRLKLELAYFGGRRLAGLAREPRGRCHPSDRTAVPCEAGRALSSRKIARNHASISRPHHPRAEALEHDIVSLDEACRRAGDIGRARRFVSIGFDGALQGPDHDAYPVLSRQGIPFTSMCRPRFRTVSARPVAGTRGHHRQGRRLALMIERSERRFGSRALREIRVYAFPLQLDAHPRARRICRPRSTTSAGATRSISRAFARGRDGLERSHQARADPNVTNRCATVNFSARSRT